MTTTEKGAPHPTNEDPFDVVEWLDQLTAWVSARPGVSTVTTAQRDLLAGPDVWAGRIIFNSTTGTAQVNKTGTPGAANWSELLTGVSLSTADPAAESFGAAGGPGASSSASRADHVHPMPAHDDAAHSGVHLNALAAPTADVPMNGKKITNLGTPLSSGDAATKGYADTNLAPKANPTFTGSLNVTSSGNAGVEIGRTDGVASTPFVDFHSGAANADYDVRLIASGGNGTNGGGTLTVVGTLAAPTPAAGTNTTQVATTAFVAAAVAALINGAPGALDQLNELAAAMGNDPNFAASMTNLLALKAPLASPALTGNPTAPTPAAGDNDTSIATTAFVQAVAALLATKASPTFSGTTTIGTADTDVEKVRAVELEIHARSSTPTYDAVTGYLTQVVEKVGATVVKTTTYAYTGDQLTTITIVAGGVTVTITLTYDAAGNYTGSTRSVA